MLCSSSWKSNTIIQKIIMGNKQSTKKLSKEDLEFLVSNTTFSKEQIKQWYSGFVRDCPDAMLSVQQFKSVYAELTSSGSSDQFCEHVFRSFDHDHSGKIDFKEFLMAINITSSKNPREKLLWAFRMYDINGDGTIDKPEMTEMIDSIYCMMAGEGHSLNAAEQTEKIFKQMDTNCDNTLSQDEFVNGCLNDNQLCKMLTADGTV